MRLPGVMAKNGAIIAAGAEGLVSAHESEAYRRRRLNRSADILAFPSDRRCHAGHIAESARTPRADQGDRDGGDRGHGSRTGSDLASPGGDNDGRRGARAVGDDHRRASRRHRARRPQPPVHSEPARSADTGAAGGNVLSIRVRPVAARPRPVRSRRQFLAGHRCRRLAGGHYCRTARGEHGAGDRRARQRPAAPVEAGGGRRPRRHVEPRPRDLPCGRYPRRRGEHALRPGREHARTLSGRRRDGSFRPRGRVGQCHALHADRRPLECRGVVPHGRDAADRADAAGGPRGRYRDRP